MALPDVLVHQYIYYAQFDLALQDIRFHEGQAIRFMTRIDLDTYQIAFGFDQVCREFLESETLYRIKASK